MSWNAPAYRYAWLEQEKGIWYFLTDLFAEPECSTRSWSDCREALDELGNEGWAVLAPYPDSFPSIAPGHVRGYGLVRISDRAQLAPAIHFAAPHMSRVN